MCAAPCYIDTTQPACHCAGGASSGVPSKNIEPVLKEKNIIFTEQILHTCSIICLFTLGKCCPEDVGQIATKSFISLHFLRYNTLFFYQWKAVNFRLLWKKDKTSSIRIFYLPSGVS